MNQTPEETARDKIDQLLEASGWTIQNKKHIDLSAGNGIAVREYYTDVGPADYILFLDRKPVGVIEAKKEDEGVRLTIHEEQSAEYAKSKLKHLDNEPLPFVYPADIVFSSFISERIRVALVPSHIREAVNKADCFCIRTNKIIIDQKYLACFLSTRTAYHQLVNEIHGATRPRINTTQLKSC